MSTGLWLQFFKDAGIPSSAAKSYAGIFEDNRITRDMLLDLDKSILGDMGIRVMGDVIGILKQAKKEARKKELIKTSVSSSAQTPAVSTTSVSSHRSMQLVPHHSEEHEEEWTPDAANNAMAMVAMTTPDEAQVSYVLPPEEELEFGNETTELLEAARVLQLRPDLIMAAHAQLQAQAEQFVGGEGAEFLTGEEAAAVASLVSPVSHIEHGVEEDTAMEEYTTQAYESLMSQRKRSRSDLLSDEVEVFGEKGASPPKLPRLALHPAEGYTLSSSSSSTVKAPVDRTRRMLESTGLYSHSSLPPNEEKPSIFSRLDQSSSFTVTSDPASVSKRPTSTVSSRTPAEVASTTPTPSTREVKNPRRTVLKASAPSVTLERGSSGAAKSGRSVARSSTLTKAPTSRTIVRAAPSSSLTSPRKIVRKPLTSSATPPSYSSVPIAGSAKSRSGSGSLAVTTTSAGTRLTERLGSREIGYEVSPPLKAAGQSTGQPATRSTVTRRPVASATGYRSTQERHSRTVQTSSGSKSSERLGTRDAPQTKQRQVHGGEPRPSQRLIYGEQRSGRSTAPSGHSTAPSGSRPAPVRSEPAHSSMVADEYETRRQLDIRSRLERREAEKRSRRQQPLPGRLERHQVFGRLE